MTRAAAIIVAGGQGNRAGADTPKQWQLLLGRRVIDWSIESFSAHPEISDIVVVAAPELGAPKAGQRFVRAEPGETRTQSVLSGLRALNLPAETPVMIHDAARPGIEATTISALIAALGEADAAAPALP
ncbi:MAG TPA: 2-C-methyl-D-erythritol 4-phosphate cytidylyltransferase, partial [Hyphomonas sp.]|nr:2-C-methyl-D-erythritol 4-phosphate cytidylyltransferase [Hyphomonas sp.]